MQDWVKIVGGEAMVVENGSRLDTRARERFKQSTETTPMFIVDGSAKSDQIVDHRDIPRAIVAALIKKPGFWRDLKK
jgi:hypothetical protein